MSDSFLASRDVIIRTEEFAAAARLFETVLALPVFCRIPSMIGFDAGGFRVYVERGPQHAPMFEGRVPDWEAAKRELLAAGSVLIEENSAVPRCYLRDLYRLVFTVEQRDV